MGRREILRRGTRPIVMRSALLVLLCAFAAVDAFVVATPRTPVTRSALAECRTEAPKAIIG